MTSIHGIDLSNLNPTLSPQALDVLYGAGVRRIIVGCQYPSNGSGNAHLNFAALKADGRFRVAAYFESQEPSQVWRLLEFAPLIDWYAVAFEQGGGCETEAQLDEWLGQADALTGKLTRIYSSAYMWHALGMDAVTKYAAQGRLLWDAHYDGRADSYVLPYPFGGWTTCATDQYSDHGFIPGLGFDVDLDQDNVEDDVKLLALSDQEKVRLGAALPGIFGAHFADLVNADPNDGYSIGLIDDPGHDVVVLTMPKGTLR